jgi:undecaprenyl-diphosphatase
MSEAIAQRVVRMDLFLLNHIISWNVNTFIRRLFYWISRSADGYLYIMYGLSLLITFGTFGRVLLLAMLAAFAANLIVYYLVKNLIKRERPFRAIENLSNLIVPPDKYSFPSGHTAGAFIIAQIMSFQFPSLEGPLFIWAALVGISRIFLRVHYPTDVIAGTVLGLVTSALGIALLF